MKEEHSPHFDAGSENSDEGLSGASNTGYMEQLLLKSSLHLIEHSSHSMSEIFIHQLIETIEFVLGTISNTASYLRLWALSLAHSQLADVFFEKTMGPGLESNNPILITLLFPIFFSASFFVLMCMDSMECFLHTLRLHWVEFQNKFYKGNGYEFYLFSLKN